MLANPFIPISQRNSFNRTRIVALPGLPSPDIRGKLAYEVFSQKALIDLIQPQRGVLGLASTDRADLPRQFDGCFVHPAPGVRAAAERIARDFGRGLGYILLTLRYGDPHNQAARSDWLPAHWAYWASIREVALGGGLLAGHLGPRTVAHTRAVLAEHHIPDLQVRHLPYGSALPMLGAARQLPADPRPALVVDFGQTHVKRALVEMRGGTITALRQLPSCPAPCEPGRETDPAYAIRLRDRMAALLADTWHGVGGGDLNPVVCVSIAMYIADGRIGESERGGYLALRLLPQHAEAALAGALTTATGVPVTVRLIHDGTAGALVCAGSPSCVVLTVGTAVGVGFPPQSEAGLRPVTRALLPEVFANS